MKARDVVCRRGVVRAVRRHLELAREAEGRVDLAEVRGLPDGEREGGRFELEELLNGKIDSNDSNKY